MDRRSSTKPLTKPPAAALAKFLAKPRFRPRPAAIAFAAAAALPFLGTLSPGRAAAAVEFPSVRLDWVAPAECIDAPSLDGAVSAQLGRPAFEPAAAAELRVAGRVERNERGLPRARLQLFARSGEALGVRVIDSDNRDCRSLDDALVVTLAIMLDVRRADLPQLVAAAAPPPAAPTPAAPPAWTWRVGASAGAVGGLLPRAGGEAHARVGLLRGERLLLEAGLAAAATSRAPAAEGTLLVGAAAVRVGAAAILVRGQPELRLGLSAGGGPMWADADDFSQVFTQTRGFADARAGMTLGVHVTGRLWIDVGAEGGVLLLRPTFSVVNADGTEDALFRPRRAIAAAALGFSYRIE